MARMNLQSLQRLLIVNASSTQNWASWEQLYCIAQVTMVSQGTAACAWMQQVISNILQRSLFAFSSTSRLPSRWRNKVQPWIPSDMSFPHCSRCYSSKPRLYRQRPGRRLWTGYFQWRWILQCANPSISMPMSLILCTRYSLCPHIKLKRWQPS